MRAGRCGGLRRDQRVAWVIPAGALKSVAAALGSNFPRVDAAIVQVEAGVIAVGDTLHFKGHTTDFTQRVDGIELEHREIPIAHPGQIIGVNVSERVREHDEVLKR